MHVCMQVCRYVSMYVCNCTYVCSDICARKQLCISMLNALLVVASQSTQSTTCTVHAVVSTTTRVWLLLCIKQYMSRNISPIACSVRNQQLRDTAQSRLQGTELESNAHYA